MVDAAHHVDRAPPAAVQRLGPTSRRPVVAEGAPPGDPDQESNWLPAPNASAAQPAFRLTIRLYGLSAKAIQDLYAGTGWQLPTILPCGNDNKTSTGIDCAAQLG